MDTTQLIDELAGQLSTTRIAFAQTIWNQERRFENTGWVAIANNWLSQAALMQEREWLSGREALLHYLSQMNSKSAKEAIAVLTSTESGYQLNARLFKGFYRQRKTKSDAMYSLATQQLLETYREPSVDQVGTESHGVTTRAFNLAKKYVKAWKSKVAGRRNG